MREFRLEALKIFEKKSMPTWGPDLSGLDTHNLHFYVQPIEPKKYSWDEVAPSIKITFENLGIPQAERAMLAGVGAQFDSEVIYEGLKKQWRDKGVIFCSMEEAVNTYPTLVKKYFSTIIPAHDNKFAALNAAAWSGGSFVYVPENVHIDMPLQAYFRINSSSFGQFERTLIIAEPGSFVHYVEGCSAPIYSSASLHAAVVEIVALPYSHIRYTTIQNWSDNVYNLVTKRAIASHHAKIEWVDGNFGSKITMKYPSIVLNGEGAQGQIISVNVAGVNQHHDSGGKIIHSAPKTTSHIVAKSVSKNGGQSSYRSLIKVIKGAIDIKSTTQCDALILDKDSTSNTYPTIDVDERQTHVGHEASVHNLDEKQLFFLLSRGLAAQEARALIVNGFIDIFVKELPMEYAIEINRLLALHMKDSIG